MSAKRYPDEFKMEAVKLVTERGPPVADVAKRLDITTHSMYTWIKKFGPDYREHVALSDAQAEVRRLKKELKRATEERDILKKRLPGTPWPMALETRPLHWYSPHF